ncbi:MAG: Ig-like domain-containing protein [Gemmatimonadota bacterium]|jgi:hypothetical protein
MRFGLRGGRFHLLAAALLAGVFAACDGSSTIVQLHGVAADLSIAVADGGSDMSSAGPVETLELPVGETVSLAVLATNAVGLPIGSASVTWTSSDPAVATVDGAGTVTGVAPGTTEVEASADEVTTSVTVTVSEEAPPA